MADWMSWVRWWSRVEAIPVGGVSLPADEAA